ncbi:MAG: TIGR04282 family arsenosugar biosynthesis glycosyltransferase [Nitrospiria bacterium]
MSNLLIIFAKAPEPGQVKTRLSPYISKRNAAKLYEAFMIDTLAFTVHIPADRALACSPNPDHPFFSRCKANHPLRTFAQQGTNLGARMKHAFEWGYSKAFEKVILIGSDAPTLPTAFIRDAFDCLSRRDVVLGPSLDGGYYLIGAKTPLPDIFSHQDWSSERVLRNTLKKLNDEKQSYELLPFWYDIDRPDDLFFLIEHLKYQSCRGTPLPKATSDMLGAIGVNKDH